MVNLDKKLLILVGHKLTCCFCIANFIKHCIAAKGTKVRNHNLGEEVSCLEGKRFDVR